MGREVIKTHFHWSKSPPLEIPSVEGTIFRPWFMFGKMLRTEAETKDVTAYCFVCPFFWCAIGWRKKNGKKK